MDTMMAQLALAECSLRKIQKQWGTPALQRPGILVYQGDCLRMMEQLRDGLFALTITSPPYNIGKEYENPRPTVDYLTWCEAWIAEVYRLTEPDGAFWLNLGYFSLPGKAKAIPIPYLLWNRVPFYLLQEIVWNYGAGVASRRTFSPRNEKFLWYVRDPRRYKFHLDAVRDKNVKYPNQKKHGKHKCNQNGKNPTDVWQFAKVTSGKNRSSKERTPHPAQFPLAIVERIIRACSDPYDLVFDPFLGSGSVAEAAVRNGRAVVGVEIEEKYVNLAVRRIERVLHLREQKEAQGELFHFV